MFKVGDVVRPKPGSEAERAFGDVEVVVKSTGNFPLSLNRFLHFEFKGNASYWYSEEFWLVSKPEATLTSTYKNGRKIG